MPSAILHHADTVHEPCVDQGEQRFENFALYAADLLFELNTLGKITYAAIGGTPVRIEKLNKNMSGPLRDFFSDPEYARITAALRTLKPGHKLSPILCNMLMPGFGQSQFILRGYRSENPSDKYFISFAQYISADSISADDDTGAALPDKADFIQIAKEKMLAAGESAVDSELTLIDLPGLEEITAQGADPAVAGALRREIENFLRQQSEDGESAGKLDEGRFGIVHGNAVTTEQLQRNVTSLVAASGLGKFGLTPSAQAVALTPHELSDEEAGRALVYAINSFAEKGADSFNISNLNDGMAAYIDDTVGRISDLRGTIGGKMLDLHFQPIVDLSTRHTHHYEALARFSDGRGTFETITFAEEIGMIEDFDLEVCQQALMHVRRMQSEGTLVPLAINLSAKSAESPVFVTAMRKLLKPLGSARRNIIFEITESARIRNYEQVAELVKQLQLDGHQVCLDDFGAGESNFNYLRLLEVDYVKIDGAYVKDVLRSPRDQAFIRAIAKLCQDIRVQTVAEFVEEESQAITLNNLGINHGQGYYFGKPAPEFQ